MHWNLKARIRRLNSKPALTSLDGSTEAEAIIFTVDKDAGSLTTNVVNQSGVELPETGGIGTRIRAEWLSDVCNDTTTSWIDKEKELWYSSSIRKERSQDHEGRKQIIFLFFI